MAITLETKLFYRQKVIDKIISDIKIGKLKPGDKLPAIKKLAKTFKCSVFTIHRSLEELEGQGYITKKHGTGTFVNERPDEIVMDNMVVMLMDIHGHVFSRLNAIITEKLSTIDMVNLPISTNVEGKKAELVEKSLLSDAQYFFIHGNKYFPYESLNRKAFQDKTIFALVNWDVPKNFDLNVHKICVDFNKGGEMVANHLHKQGHKHVLVLGTEDMINEAFSEKPFSKNHPGYGFVQRWKKLGNTMDSLVSATEGGKYSIDRDKFFKLLNSKSNPPTAIYGIMDVLAWNAQRLLQLEDADKLSKLEIIGFGDTPWSWAAQPPISTVDFNVEKVAEETFKILKKVKADPSTDFVDISVKPKLVIR